MAGVTDLAFRIICDRFGAGLSYTEMVSAKALSFSDKKTNSLMQTDNLPTAVQLFGSDAAIMASAVCEVEKLLRRGYSSAPGEPEENPSVSRETADIN